MTLVEYLETLEDPQNAFIVCANTNCEAYDQLADGIITNEALEYTTFFRGVAKRILAERDVADILQDSEIVYDRQKLEDNGLLCKTITTYVYVNYKGNYDNARRRMRERLAC